jgi:hypothetical protein
MAEPRSNRSGPAARGPPQRSAQGLADGQERDQRGARVGERELPVRGWH